MEDFVARSWFDRLTTNGCDALHHHRRQRAIHRRSAPLLMRIWRGLTPLKPRLRRPRRRFPVWRSGITERQAASWLWRWLRASTPHSHLARFSLHARRGRSVKVRQRVHRLLPNWPLPGIAGGEPGDGEHQCRYRRHRPRDEWTAASGATLDDDCPPPRCCPVAHRADERGW